MYFIIITSLLDSSQYVECDENSHIITYEAPDEDTLATLGLLNIISLFGGYKYEIREYNLETLMNACVELEGENEGKVYTYDLIVNRGIKILRPESLPAIPEALTATPETHTIIDPDSELTIIDPFSYPAETSLPEDEDFTPSEVRRLERERARNKKIYLTAEPRENQSE